MDLLKKILYPVVLVGIGFIIGRKTVGEKTVIKYVDLPPIQGEIKVPDLVPKWEGFRDPIKLVYTYKGQGGRFPSTPRNHKGGGFRKWTLWRAQKGQCWIGTRPGNTPEHSSRILKLVNLTGRLQSNTTLSSISHTNICQYKSKKRDPRDGLHFLELRLTHSDRSELGEAYITEISE